MNELTKPTIALLHCYDLIDDFLDSIDISFETFCKEFVGSWMFGYINALKQVGTRIVLFCISARVGKTSRFIHEPTGATALGRVLDDEAWSRELGQNARDRVESCFLLRAIAQQLHSFLIK